MKVLLLNQCFYPDLMATGQYLTQLAVALADQGHEVTVVTSDRGYDDHSTQFAHRETWQHIEIIRIPSLALGKQSKWRRALNFGSFLAICALRLLFLGRFDVVVALTSPPLISFLGALFAKLKGGRFCFWVMDLNPDEAIAAGWLQENAIPTRLLQLVLQYSLENADAIVVLDRFMKDRILAKGIDERRLRTIPPWAHDDAIRYDREGREAFRAQHDLADKFVVMYSGNHSPCHPLDTLLEAARRLRDHDEFVFCFVGGGSEQVKVRTFAETHQLDHVKCLPYQPLAELSKSLSAADVQVVVMGNEFVGIVHPCKIYNIMAIGSSALYVGPAASHVIDIVADDPHFYLARHGDVDKVIAALCEALVAGKTAHNSGVTNAKLQEFSKGKLLPEMVELLESLSFPTCNCQA
jgi:colanic acid biosynthesis glycosyl transferase WcaI